MSEKRARRAGCTVTQYRMLLALDHEAIAAGLPDRRHPLRAFQLARQGARRRGIEWKLNAWEWWEIWRDSGHWRERGLGGRFYDMCRLGDVGAYQVGNVVIAPSTVNLSATANKRARLPLGVFWHDDRVRFRARRIIDGVAIHLGTYNNSDEAHAAYLAAGPELDLTRYDELLLSLDRPGTQAVGLPASDREARS